ncbi:MAG: truB [Microbacteriaceae bacterium]|nr:truB [Microbacteriaceae bacterium]
MTEANGKSGMLLVDKPNGLTSHDVVARVRKRAGTKKVGHAGTLDPMATGLLVLGINNSTRLLTFLVGLDKEYFATIRLGSATNTDDAEGEAISEAPAGAIASLGQPALDGALAGLTGEIRQVPSSVSAIKVDGRRAYTLARAGEAVELAARTVTISALEVLGVRREADFLDLDVRIECSSGTYIRAIARDLGAALGVGGHLTALRRTRIGPFSVTDAAELESLDVAASLLTPAAVATRLFPVYRLTAEQAVDLGHGKRLLAERPAPGDGPVAAVAPDGRLVGILQFGGGTAKPVANFPADQKPADQKPADQKPADQKPADQKEGDS